MFKNSYQNGLLSIFYSCGANPLAIWDMEVKNGHIKRLTDNEVNSIVLEIVSTNVATTYMSCPKNNQVLGIKLPFLVMIIKNMKRYFSFEITILDDKNMRRRFRISNFQSTTKIKPFCTSMPIGLAHGWNQIQFNLADFTRRAYGTQFIETLRVQIHANARIRRIYFSEKLYSEEELPQDYKLYLPLERKQKKGKIEKKAEPAAGTPAAAAPAEGETPPPPPERKVSKKSSMVASPASERVEVKSEKEEEDVIVKEEPTEGTVTAEGEESAGAEAEGAPTDAVGEGEGVAEVDGDATAEGSEPPAEGSEPATEEPKSEPEAEDEEAAGEEAGDEAEADEEAEV